MEAIVANGGMMVSADSDNDSVDSDDGRSCDNLPLVALLHHINSIAVVKKIVREDVMKARIDK